MKLFWVYNSTNGYPLGVIPFTGNDENVRVAARFGHRIVLKLCEPYFGSIRNVTFDNYFTTMNLTKDFLQNKMTYMGTICKNKMNVPKEFLPSRIELEFSSLFDFKKIAY